MSLSEAFDDLSATIIGPEPDYDSDVEQAEPLKGQPSADRALFALGRVRARRDLDREVAEAQIAQVRAWLADRLETHRKAEDWWVGLLRRYHVALLEVEPDRLTVPLPAGELKSVMGQPSWVVTDEIALGAWLFEHHPEAIRFPPAPKPELDVNAMKAALTKTVGRGKTKTVTHGVDPDTNEMPPGLEVLPAERNFTPKPS